MVNTKRGFQYFYALVILIDSFYKKDENYCPNYFQENTILLKFFVVILMKNIMMKNV